MRVSRRAGILLVLLACCSCGLPGRRATERLNRQFRVPNSPTIIVASDAGAITVDSGADGTVAVEMVKRAPSADALKEMTVSIAVDGGQVLATYQAGGSRRQRSVDFTITAPKNARLQLQTAGGAIDVRGPAMAVSARTGGGMMTVRDLGGTVNAETGGGPITLDGALSGENSATTGGGNITATLPADSDLRVDANTAGGTINTDFGLAVSGLGSQSATGRIGDGSRGSLTLRTGGGSIVLRKR